MRHATSHVPVPGGPDELHRGLSAFGRTQAGQLVDDLADLRPDAIASSPYLRAVQTVEPLARRFGVTVTTDAALREWESGLEPRPDYADHYARSWADPDFARPGGESLAALSTRAVAALRVLADQHAGGTVVVGSHGTFVARALAGFGVAVDWPFSAAMPMPAVYRLSFSGMRFHAEGPGLR
ncbi:histidine phosphatase family protein [Saccharothrix violaceirubra]|uniref:2,3-bisphosphoglycerate-dependent phosphoglycerate mutase n=1 Tax=Saccharothrix violaceirubra TaxID=413306 RepID=A0A7W7WUA9_9PSEU|nr:histidine phosphatase family protein [Saccharothrix violaceirubra]MBB4963991.1 2,3-bisphosphoglycerate-dependent phosphoglycerate mutase [Saccharothrix violaceirubra]